MAKPIRKGLSSRKPPEPLDGHSAIDDWLSGVRPNLHPIVTWVDQLVRESIPGLQFAIKWNKVYYGVPDRGWVIELVAYSLSVNVVFLGGAAFDPPPPLGDTDSSRYIKVASLEEAQADEIRDWVQQASQYDGWK